MWWEATCGKRNISLRVWGGGGGRKGALFSLALGDLNSREKTKITFLDKQEKNITGLFSRSVESVSVCPVFLFLLLFLLEILQELIIWYYCRTMKQGRNKLLTARLCHVVSWKGGESRHQEMHNGKKTVFHPPTWKQSGTARLLCDTSSNKRYNRNTLSSPFPAEGHESEPRLDRQTAVLKQSAAMIRSFPFEKDSLATWYFHNDVSSTPS